MAVGEEEDVVALCADSVLALCAAEAFDVPELCGELDDAFLYALLVDESAAAAAVGLWQLFVCIVVVGSVVELGRGHKRCAAVAQRRLIMRRCRHAVVLAGAPIKRVTACESASKLARQREWGAGMLRCCDATTAVRRKPRDEGGVESATPKPAVTASADGSCEGKGREGGGRGGGGGKARGSKGGGAWCLLLAGAAAPRQSGARSGCSRPANLAGLRALAAAGIHLDVLSSDDSGKASHASLRSAGSATTPDNSDTRQARAALATTARCRYDRECSNRSFLFTRPLHCSACAQIHRNGSPIDEASSAPPALKIHAATPDRATPDQSLVAASARGAALGSRVDIHVACRCRRRCLRDRCRVDEARLDLARQVEERLLDVGVRLGRRLDVGDPELPGQLLALLRRDCTLLLPVRLVADQNLGDAFARAQMVDERGEAEWARQRCNVMVVEVEQPQLAPLSLPLLRMSTEECSRAIRLPAGQRERLDSTRLDSTRLATGPWSMRLT
ncbi:hypothetical protein L1887_60028 [Cichorium endivia]|nr:hypothetical protein L1887_60028 [Cichorium endivia]